VNRINIDLPTHDKKRATGTEGSTYRREAARASFASIRAFIELVGEAVRMTDADAARDRRFELLLGFLKMLDPVAALDDDDGISLTERLIFGRGGGAETDSRRFSRSNLI